MRSVAAGLKKNALSREKPPWIKEGCSCRLAAVAWRHQVAGATSAQGRRGCGLLGQDQFALARDAQPVFLAGVLNQNLLGIAEQIAAGQSFPGRRNAWVGSSEPGFVDRPVHDCQFVRRYGPAPTVETLPFKPCAQACRHNARTQHLAAWSKQRKSATRIAPQTRSW